MEFMGFCQYKTFCICLLLFVNISIAGSQHIRQINPGFEATQKEWVNNNGLFLVSNSSDFGLGFQTAPASQFFVLVVVHISSGKVVWTANRGLLVNNSDKFVFGRHGNVFLQMGDNLAWSTDTWDQNVESMRLCDSGNLELLGSGGDILWQSFSYPTDTLLPGQKFSKGMRLQGFPRNNLSVYLEFKFGDLVLCVGYETPQTYWSLANDSRRTNNSVSGKVQSATIVSNGWNFYDQNKALLWQFLFSNNTNETATWAAVLDSNGAITFSNLEKGKNISREALKIPENPCGVPEPCDPFDVCYFNKWCQCPTTLSSQFDCKPPIASTCSNDSSRHPTELFYVGERLSYFALGFVKPFLRFRLEDCQQACLENCSCTVLFFDNLTGSCFLFNQFGNFQRSPDGSVGYASYIKVYPRSVESSAGDKSIIIIGFIIVSTIVVMVGLISAGIWYFCRRRKLLKQSFEDNLEEDTFLDNFSGVPVRFSYNDLCKATRNFSTKVGQGGFGSVYLGKLSDGTQVAVKKLESIGQGKKEYRSEVCIIGSIHHMHLVKLKGFCAEGIHRLLVYEYMENGSLDKWIFKSNTQSDRFLCWDTRYDIALGTAKGLAYLHEECEVKIIHCDIKPENVLLDDTFTAKVSDFGLAKLMSREESLVYTTLRGTRGYLAPEWITNNPISEKSDVYSFGMVLLEIIGGRKNYDTGYVSDKAHLPSYVCKMFEQRKLGEIRDPSLDVDESDERFQIAVKVALWCIQDEMHLRPPMTKVVQMLEGLCTVPWPPIPSQSKSRVHNGCSRWGYEDGNSSGVLEDNSGGLCSSVQLSGPR